MYINTLYVPSTSSKDNVNVSELFYQIAKDTLPHADNSRLPEDVISVTTIDRDAKWAHTCNNC